MASVFDKLRESGEKVKTKSKSMTDVQSPEMEDACISLVASSRAYKNAEAELKRDQSVVIDFTRQLFTDAMEAGSATKSFKLNDKVLCIFTDRFTTPTEQDIQELEKVLTPQQLKKFFKQKASIKIKDSVASNEEKLNQLIALLGDQADKFFDINVSYAAATELDKIVASEEGTYTKAKGIIERLRYKPTIRLA